MDAGSGGLVLYDVEAPKDWDFATYNRNAGKIRELLYGCLQFSMISFYEVPLFNQSCGFSASDLPPVFGPVITRLPGFLVPLQRSK